MNECMICGHNNWKKYCDIDNGKYDVLICKNCSLTTLFPLPTEKELNEFYSKLYRDKYSGQDEVNEKVIAYEQHRADRVVEVINKYFDSNYEYILDIGCSSGTLLRNISNLSNNHISYGIEMNDNYREYIIKEGIANRENITNGDINSFYIKQEGKFDCISIVHVLEHLRKPKLTLESIYKLLNERGILYIEVPNLKTPYNNLRNKYFAIYHLYNFTEYTLRLLLVKIGFKIIYEQQIAGTSVCFICKKDTKSHTNKFDNNQYKTLIKILNKYETRYPIRVLKLLLIRILDFIGIKDTIKNIFKSRA